MEQLLMRILLQIFHRSGRTNPVDYISQNTKELCPEETTLKLFGIDVVNENVIREFIQNMKYPVSCDETQRKKLNNYA
ncbi:hypothetical protein AYI69_g3437 [Smittium culicis]|uniref:Uncharacterized protein n=1 Tax=Smittium culicis TaxID=133412 RepID=A0A1R1YJN9_9FUNG|nr:hypothetical protein AYI69_g3437 [Smittium culicis]